MHPFEEQAQAWSRRQFFQRSGFNLGAIALGSLLSTDSQAATSASDPLAPHRPHFKPRAKRIIYLHMIGAPSQLDMFDPKPELVKRDGQSCPDELLKGKRFAFI